MLLIMSVQLTLPLLTAYPRYTLFPPGVSACLPYVYEGAETEVCRNDKLTIF